MAVKIKRRPKAVTTPADIDGYTMVPLTEKRDGFPKMSERLIDGTYFRVDAETGDYSCLVTVMPDGLRVAWDMCGKCHDMATRCRCRQGVYHSSGIAFIRGCYDYPNRLPNSAVDYSAYYDPWNRKAGGAYDRKEFVWGQDSILVAKTVSKPSAAPTEVPRAKPRRVVRRSKPVEGGLTARDIETMDMGKVAEAAAKQAEEAIKSVRRVIRRKKV